MRTILREALKAALKKTYGEAFDFGTGFLDDINGGSYKLPCVWVCPFDLVGKTGLHPRKRTIDGMIWSGRQSRRSTK